MLYWIVATTATVFLGASKSGLGGGPGVVCTPMLAMVSAQPATAAAVMLPLMSLCDIVCVIKYGKHCVRPVVKRLLGGFIIGVIIASAILFLAGNENQRWLKQTIGALCIFFGSWYIFTAKAKIKIEEIVPQGAWFGVVAGLVAGISSMLANAAGPTIQMYLLSQGVTQDKDKHMGTVAVYALFGNLLKYYTLIRFGSLTLSSVQLSAPLAAAIPVGLLIGFWLNRNLDSKKFTYWVNVLLIPIGIFLIAFK